MGVGGSKLTSVGVTARCGFAASVSSSIIGFLRQTEARKQVEICKDSLGLDFQLAHLFSIWVSCIFSFAKSGNSILHFTGPNKSYG